MTIAFSRVLSVLQFETFRRLCSGLLSALLGSLSGGGGSRFSEAVLEEAILDEELAVRLRVPVDEGISVDGSVEGAVR